MTITDLIRPSVRRARALAELEVDALCWAWRCAAIGVGPPLARQVQAAAGPTDVTPHIVDVTLGPPCSFIVELLPGQVPDDVRAAARRLAPALGALGLRVTARGLRHVRVDLLTSDPLAALLSLDLSRPGLLIGRAEDDHDVAVDHPRDLPHMIVQGQTRSGKSIFLYSILAQMVRESDVEIAGADPSGITLRPLAGSTRHRRIALGLADHDAIERVLVDVVAEMDRRLSVMPADRDILVTDDDTPVIVIVLDEYPALLRALDATKSRDHDRGKIVRALVARLLAESHKVGFRLVIAAQRAEATIIGAAERAQCAGRLSFRVDSATSVELLHPDGGPLAAAHTSAPPGIALCSWPGRPLTRIRGPYIGDYGAFVAAVAGAR